MADTKYSYPPPRNKKITMNHGNRPTAREESKPKYSDFMTERSRRRTFEYWPRSMRQTPAALAEAGFFYIGSSDKLVCFHCGGGIKDWCDDDVPWEEHAFWFRDCPFVKKIKGDVYIQNVHECKTTCRRNSKVPILTCVHAPILCPQKKPTHPIVLNADSSSTSSSPSLSEPGLCWRCGINKSDVAFLPCGHVNACYGCSPLVPTCPACKKTRTGFVRLFHA